MLPRAHPRVWCGAAAAIAVLVLGAAGATLTMAGCGSSGDGTTDQGSDGGEEGGGVEAGSSDGGAGSDASRDAGADANEPPSFADAGPSFCSMQSPKPTFCEDFDHAGALGDFDAVVAVKPSSASLSAAEYTSGPASALIATSEAVGTTYASVLLRKTVMLGANVTHARLSFSYYPTSDMPVDGGSLGIATLDIGTGHLFTLYLRDPSVMAGPALVESVAMDTRFALTNVALPKNQWTRVVLDVDLVNAKANVTFGATKVLSDAVIQTNSAKDPTLRVGSLALGPLPAENAYVDDVVLEAE